MTALQNPETAAREALASVDASIVKAVGIWRSIASHTTDHIKRAEQEGRALGLQEARVSVAIQQSDLALRPTASPGEVTVTMVEALRQHLVDEGYPPIFQTDARAALTAALSARRSAPDAEAWQPTHRHVKRGSTYQLVGHARLQASTGPASDDTYLALYKGEDGSMWARPASEFLDGRFEALRATTQTETEADDGR